MQKNVFVVNIGSYRPDLCEYTLPTIRRYAEKIGATYREITYRIFHPDTPITYEKLQVHRLGKDAYWNILVDADFLLHPNLPDFTQILDPAVVGIHYGFPANQFFTNDIYFERDGRNQGIAGGFVITSNLTHDLWEPLEDHNAGLAATKRKFILDEYTISRNLAKYGLKYTGVEFNVEIKNMLIHIGNEERTLEQRMDDVTRARAIYESWFSGSNDNNR